MSEVVGQASAKYHVGVIRRLFSECCRGFGRGSEFEDLAAGGGVRVGGWGGGGGGGRRCGAR